MSIFNKSILLFFIVLYSSFSFSSDIPDNYVYVPHVYEFDKEYNPNNYYWCGQSRYLL